MVGERNNRRLFKTEAPRTSEGGTKSLTSTYSRGTESIRRKGCSRVVRTQTIRMLERRGMKPPSHAEYTQTSDEEHKVERGAGAPSRAEHSLRQGNPRSGS